MARQRLPLTLAACVAGLLGPAAVASACDNASSPPTRATLTDARSATVCLINEARAKHGLGKLGTTSSLARAASAHSRDMAARDFFSHDSPGGSTPKSR